MPWDYALRAAALDTEPTMEKRTRTMLPAMARQQRTQRKILYIIQTD